MTPDLPHAKIEGQLCEAERRALMEAVANCSAQAAHVLEVGTWLGGGSTLHFLKALHSKGVGHLWGVEADPSIYERMVASIEAAAPEAVDQFTPLFGLSQNVIPEWLAKQAEGFQIHVAFLDGGNNPNEQIDEFRLIDPHMPVGGVLFAHDALMRKGKFFVPYIQRLDHWESEFVEGSEVGMLRAVKVRAEPSPEARRRSERCLKRMRMSPFEIIVGVLPSEFKGWILQNLPKYVSRKLAHGRSHRD